MVNPVNIGFYRNIKLGNKFITSFFWPKHKQTPLLFDLIDLYIGSDKICSIVFRLFIQLEIKSEERSKQFQLELLDVSIHVK
jgi:hypothetical protein